MNINLNVNLTADLNTLLNKLTANFEYQIKKGLNDSLFNQFTKYYYTYTFLHTNERVIFTDIYYSCTLKIENKSHKCDSIKELFESYNYLTVIGSGGSGKSMFTKSVFINSILSEYKIPIIVELRHLNNSKLSLEQLLIQTIIDKGLNPNTETIKKALKSGRFLIILDGFDEIYSEGRLDLHFQIEGLTDIYLKNKFLITSRPGTGIEKTPRYIHSFISSLNKSDVSHFIDKMVESGERRDRLHKITSSQTSYLDYFKNPLLLSMFILAFEQHPEIPNKKSAFYLNVFDTLYSKHDGVTKNSFARERKAKIDKDSFSKILQEFCYRSLVKGQLSFTQEKTEEILNTIKFINDLPCTAEEIIFDLHTSISLLIKEGFEYTFPHRSTQEYFASLFVSKLPEKRKQEGYKFLLEAMEKTSDRGAELIILCYELDPFNFTRFVIIPELNKIKARFNSSKNLAKNYFNNSTIYILRENSKTSILMTRVYGSVIIDFLIFQANNIYSAKNNQKLKWTPEFKKNLDLTSAIPHFFSSQKAMKLPSFEFYEVTKEEFDLFDTSRLQTIVGRFIEIIDELKSFFENKLVNKERDLDDLFSDL